MGALLTGAGSFSTRCLGAGGPGSWRRPSGTPRETAERAGPSRSERAPAFPGAGSQRPDGEQLLAQWHYFCQRRTGDSGLLKR